MRIGILAPARSRQADLLAQTLDRLAPGAAVRLTADLGPDTRAALNGADLIWSGTALTTLNALYVHGFSYEDPVIPAAAPSHDWSLWQAGALIAQQGYSFQFSVLSRLEALGGPRLYNPLSTTIAAFARFTLLDRLHRAGSAIPDLVCTNDTAEAEDFRSRHTTVVWRPVSGSAAWQLFRARQQQAVVGLGKAPVMLAAVTPGPLVRVSVLDGRAVLAMETAGPSRDGLERLEVMIPSTRLSASDLDAIGRAVAGLGLRWATALVVATEAGPVFYDIDPDPVLTDLPDICRDRLLHHLAAGLAGVPMPADAPVFDQPAERSVMLLRRMLAIQFDMEQTKYAE